MRKKERPIISIPQAAESVHAAFLRRFGADATEEIVDEHGGNGNLFTLVEMAHRLASDTAPAPVMPKAMQVAAQAPKPATTAAPAALSDEQLTSLATQIYGGLAVEGMVNSSSEVALRERLLRRLHADGLLSAIPGMEKESAALTARFGPVEEPRGSDRMLAGARRTALANALKK
jgi:hypothetical protein